MEVEEKVTQLKASDVGPHMVQQKSKPQSCGDDAVQDMKIVAYGHSASASVPELELFCREE